MSSELPLIKVAGVSASGKSTLVDNLRSRGYNARPVSQEHSQVPDMWQRIRPPDVLIFLQIDLECQRQRRPDVSWDEGWLQTEEKRLEHAKRHADLVLDTRDLSPDEAAESVLAFLVERDIPTASQPLPPAPNTGSTWTIDPKDGSQ